MEEFKFTDKIIDLLYERCKQHVLAKHRVEIDYVEIVGNTVTGIHTYYCGCDTETDEFTCSMEDLNNTDYDSMISERLEADRIKREKEAEERKKREEANKLRKEREEYTTYLRLQKKFETK